MPINVISIFHSTDLTPEFDRAADLLKQGGLVVLPTETVYGVAARLDRPESRQRLEALRASHEHRPWTLHLADPNDVWQIIEKNEFNARLVRKLWPGPVGLVFDVPAERRAKVAAWLGVDERALFDEGTITLRCPDHPVFSHVVARSGGPVALTKLGDLTSQLPADFAQSNFDVDLALDSGPTRFSKPSTLLRVYPDRYEIVREGVYDRRIIERHLRTTVLFVCSGNTCRSPMAEALARRIISETVGVPQSELEDRGYSVMSAGVYALPGTRATPQAVEALQEMNSDLSRHRSQPLSVELIHQADVIYAMGRSHAAAVAGLSGAAAAKLKLLDPQGDIEDPIGSDVATYRALAERMVDLIRSRLKDDHIVE